MTTEELERRITVLEDIEAIKRLKARYCAVCDDGHNPDMITTLFADDGIWEGEDVSADQGDEPIRKLFENFSDRIGFAQHKGHGAIRKLFEGFRDRISFSQHHVMNPIIEVNGDRAKGSWYFLGPFTFRKGNRAYWVAARYEDDYVKVNGEWKFQHLRALGRMAASYQTGWANKEKLRSR